MTVPSFPPKDVPGATDGWLVADDGEAVSAHAENVLQRSGYIRSYRAIVDSCGAIPALLYGTLEDFAQLGERLGKPMVPSHATLARSMGVGERSVRRYLETLRHAGWLTWEGETGKPSRYILGDPGKFFRGGDDNPGQNGRGMPENPGQNGLGTPANLADPTPAKMAGKLTRTSTSLFSSRPPVPPHGGGAPKTDENAGVTHDGRRARRPIPDAWTLTPALREDGRALGLPNGTIDTIAAEFHAYWKSDGRVKADWDLAFRHRLHEIAGTYADGSAQAAQQAAKLAAIIAETERLSAPVPRQKGTPP